MIETLQNMARKKKIQHEMRICHHMENYHGLRLPQHFPKDRQALLGDVITKLQSQGKKSSYDMDTAVLFRVAKDFRQHAATILQTVNKEHPTLDPYAGDNFFKARQPEESIFFEFALDAILELP